MNDGDLYRLMNDAANEFEPTPSRGRLALALSTPRTSGRRLYLVLGIAAGLTALGAGAAAMTGAETAIRTPADRGFQVDVTEPRINGVESTTTTTTARRPIVVVPHDEADDDPAAIADRADRFAERDERDVPQLNDVTLVALQVETAPETTSTTIPTPTTTARPQPVAAAPTTTEVSYPEPPPTTQPHHEPPPPTTHPAPTTTEAPHQPDPPTTAPTFEFSARQFWGSCSSDPPYDEFEGHAAPGSVITVSSPYGSGSTTAAADGSWYVHVVVPQAPIGETFQFVAESSIGGSATFSFVRTG